jgi:hypothetical protein
MSSFEATFKVNGKEYPVLTCNFSFGQATDDKGRPASAVQSGNISVSLVANEDDALLGWMIDPYKKQDGSIVFNKIDQASALKELQFKEGYCVSYSESFNANSSNAMVVTLSISAREITMGNATHAVKW